MTSVSERLWNLIGEQRYHNVEMGSDAYGGYISELKPVRGRCSIGVQPPGVLGKPLILNPRLPTNMIRVRLANGTALRSMPRTRKAA